MKAVFISIAAYLSLAGAVFAGDATAVIEARAAAFVAAFNAGDATAVANLYTEDGAVLPPNAPMRYGRAAIAEYWRSGFDDGVASGKLTVGEVFEIDGENIVEVSHFEVFDADGASLDKGKYMIYWRNIGGEWLMHRDIWNSGL